ncbi:MAG: hypothetical protein HY591_06940 [Candidatus Omnitrophica bacterium]|nr:hypothetical protein [Candidatus Omnitrophota bacterium]
MHSFSKSFIFCLLFLAPALGHAETQTITLKDGSQIKGELTGVNDGTYTIKTPLLGDIHINSSQVANIGSAGMAMPGAQPPANGLQPQASNGDMGQKIQTMQTQLMANPEFMADLQQMAQDPEIMQLLADPALVQAVTAKDANALQNNPQGQKLMNNPKMRAIIEKLRGSSASQ